MLTFMCRRVLGTCTCVCKCKWRLVFDDGCLPQVLSAVCIKAGSLAEGRVHRFSLSCQLPSEICLFLLSTGITVGDRARVAFVWLWRYGLWSSSLCCKLFPCFTVSTAPITPSLSCLAWTSSLSYSLLSRLLALTI